MNAKIEWDETAADAETASIPQKLLNTVVPLYNELADLEAKFNAATNIEAAVEDQIENSTDEESLKLKEQIEKAKNLIARHTATLEENARKAVLANIDPEFDEAKYKARHNDKRNELKEATKSILGTFELLNYVTSDVSPAGRKTNFKAHNPEGEILLKVLNVNPLGKETASGKSTADPAVVEFNRAAKQWARENGKQVADKGALSKEVKEAYSAASGVPIP
jgi:hypothetical protein